MLQYAPASSFDKFAKESEAIGLSGLVANLANLEQLTSPMRERVRQITYMFASVRGMWSKVQGVVGNVLAAFGK